MSGKRTFGEIIVSQLGAPKEPFGIGGILFIAALLLVFAGYLALECGLGRLIVRLCRWLTRQ
jgi:hypothetical protein